MNKDKKGLLKAAQKQDPRALAQLLTAVEKDLSSAISFLSHQKVSGKSLRLGITGPPGAGKSSLVNLIIGRLRALKLSVAVLAVDPSSPFTGGAILGDRVRMNSHADDRSVFIRSVGSRGGFGGLSAATGAMARVFELCGFDVILIETVGVGQTELEVMNLVDLTTVVLVPESGDVIQTLKAGILEIADIFIINKADRPGADALAVELKSLVEQEGHGAREIFLTSATKNEGVDVYAEYLMKLAQVRVKNVERLKRRVQGELRHLLLFNADKKIREKISKLKFTDAFQIYKKIK